MRGLVRAGALALMLAGPAVAQDCGDDADQAALNQCADKAFAAADATLNDRYKAIMARLADDPDTRKLLVTAQRAWLDFRDKECRFAASGVEGGSIEPMIVSGCRQALTEARVAALEVYLACEEGDLSCPVPAE